MNEPGEIVLPTIAEKSIKTPSTLLKVVRGFEKVGRKIGRKARYGILSRDFEITHEKSEKAFDLESALKNYKGPIIEVGGPSDRDVIRWYHTDIENSRKEMYISNITPHPLYLSGGVPKIEYEGKIDFLADATNLPLRDGSVNVLYASCLPENVRNGFFAEAHRVMSNDSLLIAPGLGEDDMNKIITRGFHLIEDIKYRIPTSGEVFYDGVFRK